VLERTQQTARARWQQAGARTLKSLGRTIRPPPATRTKGEARAGWVKQARFAWLATPGAWAQWRSWSCPRRAGGAASPAQPKLRREPPGEGGRHDALIAALYDDLAAGTLLPADESVGRSRRAPSGARRGTSGLHRARWWLTATRGDPRDSATENRPPSVLGPRVRVKRWCKRPPALPVTAAAR